MDEDSEDELLLKDANAALQAAFCAEDFEYLEFADAMEFAYEARATPAEPRSFREAMKGPDSDKWYQAASDEFQTLLDNGTWELVKLPHGRKAIGSRWVFKVKKNADGSVERYKGRLVAQGFS
jgi:hypothetical protein